MMCPPTFLMFFVHHGTSPSAAKIAVHDILPLVILFKITSYFLYKITKICLPSLLYTIMGLYFNNFFSISNHGKIPPHQNIYLSVANCYHFTSKYIIIHAT